MREFDERAERDEAMAHDAAREGEAPKPEKDAVEALTDELMKASRLLRQRRRTLHDEAREAEARVADRLRALKLLALKPGMEQSELAELMGERLRVLDEAMSELEGQGLVERTLPEEPDMRVVKVSLTEAGEAAIEAGELAVEAPLLAPGFADEELAQLTAQLARLNAAFEALGLCDEDRRDDRRGGRDDRGGFRGGRDDRGRGRKGDYRAPGHDGTRHTQSARYESSDRRGQGQRTRKGFGNRGGRGQGSSN